MRGLLPSGGRRLRQRPYFSKEPIPRLWKALLLVAVLLVVAGSLFAVALPPSSPPQPTASQQNSNAVVVVDEMALPSWAGILPVLLAAPLFARARKRD